MAMMDTDDVETFFSELDKRMNIPDDDFEEYLARMASEPISRSTGPEIGRSTGLRFINQHEEKEEADLAALAEGQENDPRLFPALNRHAVIPETLAPSNYRPIISLKRKEIEPELRSAISPDEKRDNKRSKSARTAEVKATEFAQANAAVADPETRIRPSNVNLLAQAGNVEGPQVPRIFPEQQGIHRDSSSPEASQPCKRKAVSDVSGAVSCERSVATAASAMEAANFSIKSRPTTSAKGYEVEEKLLSVAPSGNTKTLASDRSFLGGDSNKAAPSLSELKDPVKAKPTAMATLNAGPLPSSPIEEDISEFPVSNVSFFPQATSIQTEMTTAGPSRLPEKNANSRVSNQSSRKTRDNVVKLALPNAENPKSNLKPKRTIIDLSRVPTTTTTTGNAATLEKSSIIYVSSSASGSDHGDSRTSSPVPLLPPPTNDKSNVATKSKKVENPAKLDPKPKAKAKTKTKTKEKQPLVTPVEYAEKVQNEALLAGNTGKYKTKIHKFLTGKKILYLGGDFNYAGETTRKRMDIIVKNGGTLVPKYDPEVVTHIVTDTHGPVPTLRALGLKSLTHIPWHIPTVKWNWVVSGMSRAGNKARVEEGGELTDEPWKYAAFAARIDAGPDYFERMERLAKAKEKAEARAQERERQKGKGKARERSVSTDEDGLVEFSRISEFTQEKKRREPSIHDVDSDSEQEDRPGPFGMISPPVSPTIKHHVRRPHASTSSAPLATHDPLAEFYDQAAVEKDMSGSSHDTDDDESDPGSGNDKPVVIRPAKRGFTCDNKELHKSRLTCPNQDVIDKLELLKESHESKLSADDVWRVRTYERCVSAIRNHPKRIESYAEALTIRGVGPKTAQKIMEIIQTGDLRRIRYERTEDVKATRIFRGIYGVGKTIAYQWYARGCRTLDDIKAKKGGITLTAAQEIGLKFYEDLSTRMPRIEAQSLFDLIKPIALSIDSKLFIEIMGSFRRGKADCGDIDIMITRRPEGGQTHSGVLQRLLKALHDAGIVTEDLALPDDWDDLENVYRGLCRLPNVPGARRRRIDILTVPWQSRGAALLYYTGDDIFNRAIRLKANVMGYSLNQKGLFAGVIRDPRDRRIKLSNGVLVASETEQEIFSILGVPWQEPHERVRG